MKVLIASTPCGPSPERVVRDYLNDAGLVPVSLVSLESGSTECQHLLDMYGPLFSVEEDRVQCLVMDDDPALVVKLAQVVNVLAVVEYPNHHSSIRDCPRDVAPLNF
ncbi:hypothetical protein [Novispirillum itersonii]|uniref:Uncharacterized protein n=1 Tax=Novispirillum itersonii TaxID=189 RepID=A0A7W9ZG31_NOVIT|nr:hypothetical protein [Novispirillum itersonii]MBB6210861.1 hypothetical protein [Novispirillum itersonii]